MVVTATVFSVEATSGVPLRGGVGDTQWRPTSVTQVAPRYRLAIGPCEVDLSDVVFGAGTTHVTASVGIGNLVVELPRGTAVSVAAHSGLGDVEVFGQHDGGFSTRRTMQETALGPGSTGTGPATRPPKSCSTPMPASAKPVVAQVTALSVTAHDELAHPPPDDPGGPVGPARWQAFGQGAVSPARPRRPPPGRRPRCRG